MGCSSSKDGGENVARTTVGSHLKTPEDLKDWPKFPEDCHSLLKTALTKEVWDEYKDKSDAAGVSFKTCIFSGCQNTDSHIGAYAGSADSYTTFHKLFDKIVEDYHSHKPADKHVSEMSAAALNAPPLAEDEAAMIRSTRIRVGRNLADYPLGPGVSKEQRDNIMQAVVDACNGFEGDLKGSFYPLEGMDETVKQQLIDDHFLFM
jgi:arginine kinase